MNLVNLLPVGIASLTALALALPNLKAQSPQPQPAVAQSGIAQQDTTDSPRRLAVTVKVQEPQDLKVQEGSQVKKGQVIAARDREKQRLESQRSQLTLSLPIPTESPVFYALPANATPTRTSRQSLAPYQLSRA